MSFLLVTGGAGYVGSHVVQYLVQEKGIAPDRIIVFDNFVHGHSELLPEGVVRAKGDLRSMPEIAHVFRAHDIDAVLHLAGLLDVAESMKQPGIYFQTNVGGGLNLLAAMASSRCRRIVFSSSCTVYGEGDGLVTENSSCDPISPYGESKRQFERWLEWYGHAYDIRAVSLRYFNASGAAFGVGEMHDPEIHVIPRLLKTILGEQSEFTVYGDDYTTPDGTCVRDYVHVRDLAVAHAQALYYTEEHPAAFSAFNVGSGHGVSVKELIRIAEKVTGKSVPIRIAPRRPGDAARMVADIRLAARDLAWQPTQGIEECVRDSWDWLSRKEYFKKPHA